MPSPHVVFLPSSLTVSTLGNVVAGWPDDAAHVLLDFARQRFVHPSGTVGLSCIIRRALNGGQRVSFRLGDCQNVTYWQRMRFFENFNVAGVPAAGVARAPGDRFSEVCAVDDIDDVDALTAAIVTVAAPDQEAHLIYSHVVSESLNNVCQHSQEVGFCASQFYPEQATVRFAIGDHGIGLRESLADFQPADDADAITRALEVGVTGRSRAAQLAEPAHMRNRGVGLSAISRLVAGNGGTLSIWSGKARYQQAPNGAGVVERPHWQGTLVSVAMPRNLVTAQFRDIMQALAVELRDVERSRQRDGRR